MIIQKFIIKKIHIHYLFDKHNKICTNHIINLLIKQTHQANTITIILSKLGNTK